MTWVKIADTMPDHPKVVAAGDLAGWLYVCGLCYCSRHLTDGVIPKSVLPRLTGLARPAQHAKRLVEVGLWEWEASIDGWRVHDYAEHQRTKEEVEQQRVSVRQRVKKHRYQQRGNAVTNGEVTPPEREEEDRSTEAPTDPRTAIKSPRKPDVIFEALAEACGWSLGELTKDARGRLNAAAKQLRELGAVPGDIGARTSRYRQLHPEMPVTPQAITGNWAALSSSVASGSQRPSLPNLSDDKCERCDGFRSLNECTCPAREAVGS